MRKCHQIPCLIEDLFRPLQDAMDGRAICRHYHKQFVDIYKIRSHINIRICLHFDVTKEAIAI